MKIMQYVAQSRDSAMEIKRKMVGTAEAECEIESERETECELSKIIIGLHATIAIWRAWSNGFIALFFFLFTQSVCIRTSNFSIYFKIEKKKTNKADQQKLYKQASHLPQHT